MLSVPDSTYYPTVLQLCLNRTAAPSGGTCTFKIQTAERTITSVTVACSAMGLPATRNEIKAAHIYEHGYMIPTSSLLQLKSDIAETLHEDVPLWLQFSSDCGNLPLLPWERLLHPIIGVPILRMPYYDFKPFAATSSCLDIVLCASRWGSNDFTHIEVVLDRLARSLLEAMQALPDERGVVVIHIFSDQLTYQHLQRLLADRLASSGGSGVRLYNPEDATDSKMRTPSGAICELPATFSQQYATVQSTKEGSRVHGDHDPLVGDCIWLLWILNAFQGRSADAVHFLGRGTLSSDQGSLLLAGIPDNTHKDWTWSIGAQQLTTFSTYLGAWSIGFSTPDPGPRSSGLRLLIDQLARLRPGPVLLQEGTTARGEQTLAKLYRFLCNEVPDVLPATPELSIYCHPSRTLKDTQLVQAYNLHQYTLAKGTPLKIMQSAENTPGWIASTQRYLEQSTAQLLHTPDTPSVKKSTQQGIEQALSFLSTILTQHTVSDKDESSQENLL